MKNSTVISYKKRLDYLFEKVDSLSGDLELQGHWARYLCVLVSGFLETSVIAIYSQYAQAKATPNVAKYVAHGLDGFTNPNMTRIIQVASCFNAQWGTTLEQQTAGKIKDAVDSICANRNSIAHGKNTGISYVSIKQWYKDAITVVELLEKQCSV
jgi:hypothetical protein